jgi:hypothetical protein
LSLPGEFLSSPPDFPESYFIRKVNTPGTSNRREEGSREPVKKWEKTENWVWRNQFLQQGLKKWGSYYEVFSRGGREKFILDLIIARLGWGFGRMGIIIGRIDLGCQLDS